MPRENGFTLIELICTLVVLSLLALIGMATCTDLIRRNDQQVLFDDLNTAISYAKMQAIHLNKPLYLFPLKQDANWAKGIMLKQLNQHTQKFELIHQWQWHHSQWLVSWSGANGGDFMIVAHNPSRAMSNGSFDLYNIGSKTHLYLKINRLGRTRSYGIIK